MKEEKTSFQRAGLEHPEEENGQPAVVLSDLPEQSVTVQKTQSFPGWIQFHLTNLPSAVLVLSVIAGLAVIGTIVPQKQPFEDYVRQYGQMKANMLHALGFQDVYHTIYFNVLLGWIGVSAIWCSYLRFVRTWKLQFTPRVKIKGRTIERLRHRKVLWCKDEAGLFGSIEERLKKQGFRIHTLTHPDGTLNLYGSRGMRRMWSLVVLHFALIAILLGALLNLFLGQNGTIPIEDGETKVLSFHAGDGKPKLVRSLVKGLKPMTFTLHNEKFEITYDKLVKELNWEKMGMNPPEAYRNFESFIVHQFTSNLTVERDGRKKSKVISVNYPLSLDKLLLYQSALNRSIEVVAKVSGEEYRQMVSMNVPFEITPNGITAIPPGMGASSPFVFLIDDIKTGPWYQSGVYKGELEPQAMLRILDGSTGETQAMEVITKSQPISAPMFSIGLGEKVVSTSIFQWKRDPGLPLVYLGFITVVLGVLGTLFFRFQQVYVRAEKRKFYMALRSTGIAEDSGKFLDALTEGHEISV